MTGGDADEVDITSAIERLHQFERRDRSSTGDGVPALFERHRDPHLGSILPWRRR